jgi:hypothetical protein
MNQALYAHMNNKRKMKKNLNIDLPYDQQYHSWGYTQKNMTQASPEALAHPCLLQLYSQ